METFIEFIKDWGYIVVLFGAMIEGESIILSACVLAYLGYLSIFYIVLIAFFGTLFADQALFYLGRAYGMSVIDRFPSLKAPAAKAFALLHRWDGWLIISFRFIYGIRIISPVVIGSAGVAPQRFIPLNIFSALIWTAISCSVGYFVLGKAVDAAIDTIEFEKIEGYFFGISIGLLLLLVIGGYFAWKKLHSPQQPTSTGNDDGKSFNK